jgi:hypothetical protein
MYANAQQKQKPPQYYEATLHDKKPYVKKITIEKESSP